MLIPGAGMWERCRQVGRWRIITSCCSPGSAELQFLSPPLSRVINLGFLSRSLTSQWELIRLEKPASGSWIFKVWSWHNQIPSPNTSLSMGTWWRTGRVLPENIKERQPLLKGTGDEGTLLPWLCWVTTVYFWPAGPQNIPMSSFMYTPRILK